MPAFALAAAAVLAVLWLTVRWLEPRMAFFPSRGETVTPSDYGTAYEAVTIETADGERLRAWRIPAREPRAFVVYFHGNGANLSNWAPILVSIVQHGYSVLAIDYRGYGLSSGAPTEQGLYRDADGVLAAAEASRVTSLPVVYWGRSVGTAVAAYAASVNPPDGVILEAGFPQARSLFRGSPVMALLSVFSSYRFPTATFMAGVRAPTLVLHGDRDSVIPYELGRELFEAIPAPKTFVTIKGGDHNDAVPADASYWGSIEAFVDGLPRSPREP